VKPPRVARSPVALECKYFKTVQLFSADGSKNKSEVVIGEVIGVHIDDAMLVNGHVDVTRMKPIARLGYMDYAVVEDFFTIHRPAAPDDDTAPEDQPDATGKV
jgi:flavin reductase (DIM6/NTAB) family NADH-FMN oxidoreductase RutF